MAQIIKTDGTIVDVEPKNGTDFQLEELQNIVEGYIEIVYLPDDRDHILVVNEEGAINGMPFNADATLTFWTHLYGNVLYCKSSEVR